MEQLIRQEHLNKASQLFFVCIRSAIIEGCNDFVNSLQEDKEKIQTILFLQYEFTTDLCEFIEEGGLR